MSDKKTSKTESRKLSTLNFVLVKHWRIHINQLIATELNHQVRYYDKVSYITNRKNDSKYLINLIDHAEKEIFDNSRDLSKTTVEEMRAVILNGNLNYDDDIQATLQELKISLNRFSRIFAVLYNPYYSLFFNFLHYIGIISGDRPKTFVTINDLEELARLSEYEIVRMRPTVLFPLKLAGLGTLINLIFSKLPFIKYFCAVGIYTLRPIIKSDVAPKISIVIPARNEEGNIEKAINRLPHFPVPPEIIFIEGNSTDGTWKEIQRVQDLYKSKFNIVIGQQTGKGKSNAVDKGFSLATGEVLTILDADLTMPPEKLILFYNAYCEGKSDFINGSRLLYEMEGEAMKFLNKLGNIFFAKSLGVILETRLSDSLCGTKLFPRPYLKKFEHWKKDFGDYDPFGDFNMIFPACAIGIGLKNLHIKYLDRTYGTTNISRFSDGLKLLRMTVVAFFKIKIGF